ncbi:MAG: ABC transporter permease [Gammaproteobacteria bacterium]
MTEYLIRRLLQGLLVIFAMSLVVFVGVFAIGDPMKMFIDPAADQDTIAATMHNLGLDRPMWEQYLLFVWNALQGDLGQSFFYDSPALSLILNRMPATLELAVVSTLIAAGFGIPLGMVAGYYPDSFGAKAIMTGSILGFSLPSFWVGLMLILIFAVEFGWAPSGGRGDTVVILGIKLSVFTRDGLSHIIMPAINLALFNLALVVRLTRANMRETLPQDFVKYARAKGLRMSRIISVHVLKNIMIPVVTIIGMEFGTLIAFAIVTETVFSWPGMGKLILDSIIVLDRPVIVAYLMIVATMFVLINLAVDVLYSFLDPRIRISDVAS